MLFFCARWRIWTRGGFQLFHQLLVTKKTLTYLLGVEHQVGLEFLCSTEQLKCGTTKNAQPFSVVKAEWDKFIMEENLDEILETVNRTSLHHIKC